MEQPSKYQNCPVRLYLPIACQNNLRSRFNAGGPPEQNALSPHEGVLSPYQALERLIEVRRRLPEPLSVWLSGPGEVLAGFDQARETLRLLRQSCPDAGLGIRTNGLMLPVYATHLISLGVTQVCVDVNTVSPETGALLIDHVFYMGNRYFGVEGANILIQNQMAGISYLTAMGIDVEINTLFWEGINAQEAGEIFNMAWDCKARMGEIISLPLHAKGKESLAKRAKEKCRFAVCTSDGRLINQHFGQVTAFGIYDYTEDGQVLFVESRPVDRFCRGPEADTDEDRIYTMIKVIEDCSCVLCTRMGYCPSQTLAEKKLDVYITYNLIEDGLAEAYSRLYQTEAVLQPQRPDGEEQP